MNVLLHHIFGMFRAEILLWTNQERIRHDALNQKFKKSWATNAAKVENKNNHAELRFIPLIQVRDLDNIELQQMYKNLEMSIATNNGNHSKEC